MKNSESGVIFSDIGIAFWPMLVPGPGVNAYKWSVIACDQFTSNSSYWDEVSLTVNESPSTLHCIFPEVFLGDGISSRIESIKQHMNKYLSDGTLVSLPPGCMWIERDTGRGLLRHGVVLAVDLEQYDYTPGSSALIKATEKTILERIPPRVEIRKDAPVEFPHVLVLFSDPDKTVEDLFKRIISEKNIAPTYDTELMKGGGHITGTHINGSSDLDIIAEAFRGLLPENPKDLLFAVGDGNHSLATAKTIWEKTKSTLHCEEIENHPARFALVEMVNLYDEGLRFEPIHRVIFNTEPEQILEIIRSRPELDICEITKEEADSFETESTNVLSSVIVLRDSYFKIYFKSDDSVLAAGELQKLIDSIPYKGELDFIHGFSETMRFGSEKGNISFIAPPIDPGILFTCVRDEGVLPRKTFSLGHAEEKRYYFEGKII